MRQQLRQAARLLAYTVILLFFLELVTEFIAAIYAFGLLGTSIPPEIGAVVVFFAPALLLLWRGSPGRRTAWVLGTLLVASRLGAVLLDTRGRLLLSGAGVVAGLLLFPLILWRWSRREEEGAGREVARALLGAVLLAIFFRTAGSGANAAVRGLGQPVSWLLAGAALFILLRQWPAAGATSGRPPPAGRGILPATLGLTCLFALLYFAFASPNVMAAWTGTGFLGILVALLVGIGVGVGFELNRPLDLPRSALWIGNGLFLAALLAAILPQQIRFPAEPGAYPLFAPDPGILATLPLIVALLLFPILMLDAALFVDALVRARPSLRSLGGAFTLGGLVLLLLIFSHVFTTVYDYIPVIGPFFRDKFWLVHLVAGLGVLLPLLSIRPAPAAPPPRAWGVGISVVMISILGAFQLTQAQPTAPLEAGPLRVVTYNIQQGYDAAGEENLAGQLALLRTLDADLLGLQESDSNRIAGGNVDIVRYFANALDMHAYYGPSSVPGTFGVALLSRYPLQNPQTFYMYSIGEQTATIAATITLQGQPVHVYVTHLGNGGPIVQQEAILEAVGAREAVILMGDFNFRDDTAQYRLTTAQFDDAWVRSGRPPPPDSRIDHIFVSPSLQVLEMRYLLDPASDHPAALAVIAGP